MSELAGLKRRSDGARETPALFAAAATQLSDDAYWLIDAQGTILAATGSSAQIVGRDEASLRGVHLSELSAIDSAARIRAWLSDLTSSTTRRETRLHRPDGTFVDVELALVRPSDADGVFVCTVHDISERRATELAMRADAEGYRAVFDHALDAMIAVDDECRVVDLNDAARALLGGEITTLVGRAFESFLDPLERSDFLVSWARVLEMGEERGQSKLAVQDGLSRRIEYAIRAHYKLGHHLVVVRDITARHELELQLRQAQKLEALGRLAGGVAHDFNNLLTAVLVSADVLLEDMPAEDRRLTDLLVIRDAANRASLITRQLLSFGKQQWSAPQTFDLHAVITESTRMLRRLIGTSIAIETELGEGPYHVRADEGQLEQILLNLALNARDAMPDGGTLTVRVRLFDTRTEAPPLGLSLSGEQYIELRVRDNGVGMDSEVQARLFEPFFTTKSAKGTGLGLPTVYGIVQQCGGSIHVDSTLSLGSTFTVYLPKAENPTPPRGVEAIPAPASHLSGRVLLVDDDTSVRTVVARLLERSGHVVAAAGNPADALALLARQSEPFDLLISDLSMPGMRGDALAQEVLAHTPSMHVIFITGDAIRDLTRVDTRGRPAVVLRKPFSTNDLEQQVQRALEQRALELRTRPR